MTYGRNPVHDDAINQVRIETARADAMIGCDLVVSSSPKASQTYNPGHTRVLLNSAEMATGDFVMYRDANLRADVRIDAIRQVVGDANLSTLNANAYADKIMGNTIYANIMLLGCAWQHGMVPVSLEALMRAIELNGIEIEKNKRAFSWGRIAACGSGFSRDWDAIEAKAPPTMENESLDQLFKRRAAFLTDYQDQQLSDRYIALVNRVKDAEASVHDNTELTEAVAKSYFKLLSYKDEYEVARLHTQTGFLEKVKKEFGDNAKVHFHMAPPLISRQKDARGRPRKKEFGAWMVPLFRILARLRFLRGTRFDPFGLTAERRLERALIVEFETLLSKAIPELSDTNIAALQKDVSLYMDIRGYGPVKEQAVKDVHAQLSMRRCADGQGRN